MQAQPSTMGPYQRAQPAIILFLVGLLAVQTVFERAVISTEPCRSFDRSGSGDSRGNVHVPHSDVPISFSETKLETSGTTLANALEKKSPKSDKPAYGGPSTTWNSWPHDRPFPCVPGEKSWRTVKTQRSPADSGLLFVREMKTGSSTVSGVLLRLAHRKGQELLDGAGEAAVCRMRVDHSSARSMQYARRNQQASFLISLLRDPTKRAISHFFHFQVSQMKWDPTDNQFQSFFAAQEAKYSNYYAKDLTMRDIDIRKESPEQITRDILDQYNFIAITERMDESLVVFKMLLGLEFEDILYMTAKSHGSFTTGPGDRPCIYLTPSFLTDGMKEFFASEYWKEYLRVDHLLYDAAVQSLENTIEALGRSKVEEELAIFQKAQAYAHDKCSDRTIYRCNAKGENVGANSTCYMWDIGCGYECLNEVSVDNDVLDA